MESHCWASQQWHPEAYPRLLLKIAVEDVDRNPSNDEWRYVPSPLTGRAREGDLAGW